MKLFKHLLRFVIPLTIIYGVLWLLDIKVAWWIIALAGLVVYAVSSFFLFLSGLWGIHKMLQAEGERQRRETGAITRLFEHHDTDDEPPYPTG